MSTIYGWLRYVSSHKAKSAIFFILSDNIEELAKPEKEFSESDRGKLIAEARKGKGRKSRLYNIKPITGCRMNTNNNDGDTTAYGII